MRPWIASQLIDTKAWSRLKLLASAFPAALTDSFYLECHLGPGSSRTDLILELSNAGRAILAGKNPVLALDPTLLATPVWATLARFCRHWIEEDDELMQRVKRIWLEFDLEDRSEPSHQTASPRVFIDWNQPLSGATSQQVANNLLDAYGTLAGQPPFDRLRHALRECLGGLPAGTSVYSTGFFPNQTAPAVRLCLRGTEEHHLDFLREVGQEHDFPCRLAAAEGGTPRATGRRKRILHLDVSASGASRAGLEYGLRRLGRRDLRTSSYLDCLITSGLCTPAKRAGLAAWPGGRVETFPHELWPSLAVRWVNHIKITVPATGTAQAKAYLCHRHVPRIT